MTTNSGFPIIDKTSKWYLSCKRKRDNGNELCLACPFRGEIENQELPPCTCESSLPKLHNAQWNCARCGGKI
jgi:hypothetical protein